MSNEKLKNWTHELFEIDQKIKRGQIDPEEGEKAMLNLNRKIMVENIRVNAHKK